MEDPIRICIGTEPRLRVVEKVLKHTILKRTNRAVVFTSMICEENVQGSEFWNNCPHGATGFSYRRWMIPSFFDYSGSAIYIDCDQVVMADIGELWDMPDTLPKEGCVSWCAKKRAPLPSVMMLDCAQAKRHEYWHPEKLWAAMSSKKMYPQHVMRGGWMEPHLQKIPLEWNDIDHYIPGQTKLLHYSDLRRQPWFYMSHPLRNVWEKCLKEAVADGSLTKDEVFESVSMYGRVMKGYKRPPCGLHPHYKQLLENT